MGVAASGSLIRLFVRTPEEKCSKEWRQDAPRCPLMPPDAPPMPPMSP